MSVSLVLPCYNPAKGWAGNIVLQYQLLSALVPEELEIIIVQDGLSDSVTNADIELLRQNIPGLQLIAYMDNMGKGFALREGIEQATGEIIIYTDIDFPYSNESFYKIYHALSCRAADVAVGVKDMAYYEKVPPLRRIISKYLQYFIRTFVATPITDTQCGLKGFRAEIKPIFLATTINRYLFDLEFVRSCYKNKCLVSAIPVTLNPGVHFRPMNYKVLLPEIVNFIKILLR
jgi:glycosyltransferase involved in cell wall biosynthesis